MTPIEALRAHNAGKTPILGLEPGCYVESSWGRYSVAHMIEQATGFGYRDAEVEDLAARHLASMGRSDTPGLTHDELEALSDSADSVEDWLNEHATVKGYSWGWWEGEFHFQTDSWWENDGMTED